MIKRLAFTVSLVVPLLLSGCLSQVQTKDNQQAEVNLKGIDVSKYQGDIDFTKIKAAGISYVFVRASEGNTYQDANFKTNFNNAKAAGLTVSAYHFYESNDAPDTQLKNFTNIVTLSPGDLPPVVDIEKLHMQDDDDLMKNLMTYLTGLETHYGVKPIIYTGLNFANQYVTQFSEYPLWLAEYEVSSPTVPSGWKDWTFWQYSQAGSVDGIVGDVDVDKFNGDLMSFSKLLIKQP